MDVVNVVNDTVSIANVVIHVADMDRSLPFYRDGLGLQVRFDSGWNSPSDMLALSATPDGTPMRIVAFELAGTAGLTLCCFRREASEPQPFEAGGTTHVGLTVANVSTAVAVLESLGGVRIANPDIVGPSGRRVKLAFVRDPDGGIVELVERIAASSSEETTAWT